MEFTHVYLTNSLYNSPQTSQIGTIAPYSCLISKIIYVQLDLFVTNIELQTT